MLDKSEPPELDYDYLNETTSSNQVFQRELARIFLAEVPVDLAAIATALAANDTLAAGKIAHSMKSTVGYMGFAQNIGAQLTEFELACLEAKERSLLFSAFEALKNNLEKAIELVRSHFFQST